jgi:hypothetical protein
LSPYIVASKNSTTTKTSLSSSKSEIEKSGSSKNQILSEKKVHEHKFTGEVHQCLFLNDDELIVYIRSNFTSPHDHKVVKFNLQTNNLDLLIHGESKDRSIERICLTSDSNILVSANRKLVGKDDGSKSMGKENSFRAVFLKAFNFSGNSELLFYEGGGELIAISKDCKWVANAKSPGLFNVNELFNVTKLFDIELFDIFDIKDVKKRFFLKLIIKKLLL